MSETESLNDIGAKVVEDVNKNPHEEGPQTYRSAYSGPGTSHVTEGVRSEDGDSSVERTIDESSWSGTYANKTTARANVAGESAKVKYNSSSSKVLRMGDYLPTKSETTITRTDENGDEIYKHTSNDPAMASKVGELAAKNIRQELPEGTDHQLAA